MNPPFFWHRHVPELKLVITMFVSPDRNRCGIFVGSNRKVGAVNVAERLRPHVDAINAALGLNPSISTDEFPFLRRWNVNCYAEDNWPAMADWLVTEAARYEHALKDILKDRA